MFNNILIEKEHEDLLILIVEATRNNLGKPRKFIIHQTTGGDFIHHPGLPDHTSSYFGYAEYLSNLGFISFQYDSQTSAQFDVLPLGFKYYNYIKSKSTESIAHIPESVKQYIESENFQKKYPTAYYK